MFKKTGPGFTATVEGKLDGQGIWQMEGRIRFTTGAVLKTGGDLLGRARKALIEGIVAEGARARSLGARSVRLQLDTGDRKTDLAIGRMFPGLDTVN